MKTLLLTAALSCSMLSAYAITERYETRSEAEPQEITVVSTFPEDGQEMEALYSGESITFELSDNSEVSEISCVITSIINSNNAEEPFGSFRTSEINAEGKFYWKNEGGNVYFLQGRTYRFQYFVFNKESKVAYSGEINVIGATDPDTLIDYDFNPVEQEIVYYGTPESIESVVVTMYFDEDAYCDFNKFLTLKLTDSEGNPVKAQFTSQSSMKEPTKYGIKISGADLVFDQTYILHIPTMFGDAEWFGVEGGDKYLTGRANAPFDIKFNLQDDGEANISSILCSEKNEYYDLFGTSHGCDKSELQPGIYICKGKKIVIK